MPLFQKRKFDRGFAHPIIFLVGTALVLTVALILYKVYKERPIEDEMSMKGETVAGVSAPTAQIAAIPKAECDFFVATNGNNSNSGTSENSPLRTIQAGANKLQSPGDTLCIKGGVYREQVSISNKNGNANNPIKVGGYVGGGLPIVSGGITAGDEYMLPDPQCKVKDVCGANVSDAGACQNRNGCIRQILFAVADSSYVHVYGIDVRGSSGRGFALSDTNNTYVKGVRSYHNWSQGFQIGSNVNSTGNNNVLEYIAAYDNIRALPENKLIGGGAIHVNDIKSGSIKNSLIFENFGEGLDVHKGTTNFTVADSMFWDNFHGFLYANGATNANLERNFLFCTKNRVAWLEASGYRPGANTGYGSAITLRNEDGVTSQHGEGGGTIAANNIIAGCTNGIIIAAQKDANLSDVWVLNNTIISPRDFPAGPRPGGGNYAGKKGEGISVSRKTGQLSNINIENNIILADSSGDSITGSDMANPGVKYVNNIVSKAPSQNRPGVTVADPKLSKNVGVNETLDPATIDAKQYYITSGSPAIGAGTKSNNHRGTQDKDFYGNNRGANPIDLGAYEFGMSRNWNNLYNVIMAGNQIIDDDDETDPPAPPADSDGDGVVDADDECPNVAQGTTPDPQRPGCPLEDNGGGEEEEEETTAGTNLVKNPAFKEPATAGTNEVAKYWNFAQGVLGNVTATITRARNTNLAKGEALLVTVNSNPLKGAPTVNQGGIDLNPQTNYEISFSAKASLQNSRIIVDLRDMGAIQEALAPRRSVELGEGWKRHTLNVRTKNYNPNKAARLILRLQVANGGNITLDNISIKEIE